MIDVGQRMKSYEIVSRLRSGGMATLFLGRREGAAGFARHVAIKVVHPHLVEDAEFVRMFVAEALLSARIQHPNVVHVEELGESDGTYFLVMEYVQGCSLSELLRELGKRNRRLSPEVAVYIALQVADGLHAAHEARGEDGAPLNVVHRDVSPQNVLLAFRGHVKLIDFGIAKAGSHHTATGSLKGKLRYMPPEQAYGKNVDRRSDLYALAIVLWEMLTMRRMFRTGDELALLEEVRNPKVVPPSLYAKGIDEHLDRAVLAALAPDPSERPATVQEWRRMLADAMPSAARLDSERLAELLASTMHEASAQLRELLPGSMSGITEVERAKPLIQKLEPRTPEQDEKTIASMTVIHTSAGDAPASSDGPRDRVFDEASVPSTSRTDVPSAQIAVPTERSWLGVGLLGTLVLAGGVTLGVMVAQRSHRNATATAAPAAPIPAPTTPVPSAPPHEVAPPIANTPPAPQPPPLAAAAPPVNVAAPPIASTAQSPAPHIDDHAHHGPHARATAAVASPTPAAPSPTPSTPQPAHRVHPEPINEDPGF